MLRARLLLHQHDPTTLTHPPPSTHVQVPNASPTAASASSDMYGAAAADACAPLAARLAPFRAAAGPGATLAAAAASAYASRIDLSAHGFYATPDITGFGGDRPFNYWCAVGLILLFFIYYLPLHYSP